MFLLKQVYINIIWNSYRIIIVKTGGGSFSITCHSHFFTRIILRDWIVAPLREINIIWTLRTTFKQMWNVCTFTVMVIFFPLLYLSQLMYSVQKDTLLFFLGKHLYLTGALQLLRYHKQQVGVVYPLGMNQPAEKERERRSSVNNLPLLACILHSFANESARFMRQPYKAHLASITTVS